MCGAAEHVEERRDGVGPVGGWIPAPGSDRVV